MSSVVTVNIDISDINDNPPTFSPANHTAVIQVHSLIDECLKICKQTASEFRLNLLSQENKPIGTSILQLSVTDKDAAHNGPPFQFRILLGNEGMWFSLDREGLITSNQMFHRSERTEYVIQVEVRTRRCLQHEVIHLTFSLVPH